jgi:hypothetical protein
MWRLRSPEKRLIDTMDRLLQRGPHLRADSSLNPISDPARLRLS